MATRNYDKNDVLKYVYGEFPPAEEGDFVEAMCADDELFQYYQELKDLQVDLDEAREDMEVELEPSEFSVHQILNHVRKTGEGLPKNTPSLHTLKNRKLRIAGLAMVAVTALFVIFTVFIYQSSLHTKEIILSSSLQWDATDLSQRIEMARLNAGNINGEREVILPVYSNTYQLIHTGDFAPALQNVVLLSIE